MTTFDNKCEILSDVWLNYRNDDEFVEFIEYNDLGLPFAYGHSSGLITLTDMSRSMIIETFDNLISLLGIIEDVGFESIGDMFGQAEADGN